MLRIWSLLSISYFLPSTALNATEIVIVILSQSNGYHLELAQTSKRFILEQTQELNQSVHLSHEDFHHVGGWTIIPMLPKILELYGDSSSWIVFVEDRTKVTVHKLVELLRKYNQHEERFIGYVLRDLQPSIIHHYHMDLDFKYPNIASGFALSTMLLKRLCNKQKNTKQKADFSIDRSHELALFVWDADKGPTLQHDPGFCITEGPECATYPQPLRVCGEAITRNNIYFAVKTCSKFHRERIPVVKNTWGKEAELLRFFSDSEDKSIPTVHQHLSNPKDLCMKTMDIVNQVEKELRKLPDVRWVVIADDDTILSVSRLQQLLSCYDAATPTALGERYGYNVFSVQGYNFITMGGGMVFSRTLIEVLAKPGVCVCPKQPQPDDMYLGICLAMLGIDLTHSSLFHQAKPEDYAADVLQTQAGTVSFHRYWNMMDARKIYEEWFMEADLNDPTIKHSEL